MPIEPVSSGKLHIGNQPVAEATTKAAEPSRSKREEGIQDSKSLRLMLGIAQEYFQIRDLGLQFSVDEGTDRIKVTVFEKETGEVIREVPSQQLLDMVAKIDEMMGMLFDHKA